MQIELDLGIMCYECQNLKSVKKLRSVQLKQIYEKWLIAVFR